MAPRRDGCLRSAAIRVVVVAGTTVRRRVLHYRFHPHVGFTVHMDRGGALIAKLAGVPSSVTQLTIDRHDRLGARGSAVVVCLCVLAVPFHDLAPLECGVCAHIVVIVTASQVAPLAAA